MGYILSIYLSIFLSIYLSVISFYLSIVLSFYVSIVLSISAKTSCVCIGLTICISFNVSMSLFLILFALNRFSYFLRSSILTVSRFISSTFLSFSPCHTVSLSYRYFSVSHCLCVTPSLIFSILYARPTDLFIYLYLYGIHKTKHELLKVDIRWFFLLSRTYLRPSGERL